MERPVLTPIAPSWLQDDRRLDHLTFHLFLYLSTPISNFGILHNVVTAYVHHVVISARNRDIFHNHMLIYCL